MLMYQHTLIANLIEASGGQQTRSIETLMIRIHAKLGSSVNCILSPLCFLRARLRLRIWDIHGDVTPSIMERGYQQVMSVSHWDEYRPNVPYLPHSSYLLRHLLWLRIQGNVSQKNIFIGNIWKPFIHCIAIFFFFSKHWQIIRNILLIFIFNSSRA